MAKVEHTSDARVLVGIDISKHRHEVLIAVPALRHFSQLIIPARLATCCKHCWHARSALSKRAMRTRMSKRTNDEMQPRGAQIFPSVEALEQLRREVLIDLWPKVMGTAVPRSMSQGLLRRFLAFELQARTSGGLSKADLAEIARLGAVSSRAKTARMGQGSRFFREWNGITHVVERTEAGYLWNGAVHASLSAIAKAITGAHWSGPRFFGVKTAPNAAASKKRAPK